MMNLPEDSAYSSRKMRSVRNTVVKITHYLKMQDDVSSALMVGSQARKIKPADEWSDIDIVIITTNPDRYLMDSSWLEHFGIQPKISFVEETANGGVLEKRVLFNNGVAVDFTILPLNLIKENINTDLTRGELTKVLQRGVILIKDENKLVSSFMEALLSTSNNKGESKLPSISESEFSNSVNDFFFHVVWTHRKLLRGELWSATNCLDCYMKSLLLQMTEWYSKAKNSEDYDTWHSGRFIEQWADKSILKDFHGIFAHYDYHDIEPALRSTVKLYSRMAKYVANHYGFNYPTDVDQFAWKQTKIEGKKD